MKPSEIKGLPHSSDIMRLVQKRELSPDHSSAMHRLRATMTHLTGLCLGILFLYMALLFQPLDNYHVTLLGQGSVTLVCQFLQDLLGLG